MSGKIKTCYIAAPGDSSLEPLRKALFERGISVVNPHSLLGDQQPSTELVALMGRADLVIGILSRDRRSDWTLFELGVAWSTGRQVLLVVPPGASLSPPSGLIGVLQIRANPSNVDAIAFALDQLQAAPDSDLGGSSLQSARPAGRSVADLKEEAIEAIRANDGRALEHVVHSALLRSHLDAIADETSSRDAKADFAVWVDELTGTVGNPLLIEVKLRLQSAQAMRAAAGKFSSAITASGTRFGLLLYGEGPEARKLGSAMPFNVLTLSVADLLEGLVTRSFASIVASLRNQRVHGVDA